MRFSTIIAVSAAAFLSSIAHADQVTLDLNGFVTGSGTSLDGTPMQMAITYQGGQQLGYIGDLSCQGPGPASFIVTIGGVPYNFLSNPQFQAQTIQTGCSVNLTDCYVDFQASTGATSLFSVSGQGASIVDAYLTYTVSSYPPPGDGTSPTAAQLYSILTNSTGVQPRQNSALTIESSGIVTLLSLNVTGFSIDPSPVPLPATVWLMLSGIGGLVFFGRYRRSGTAQV